MGCFGPCFLSERARAPASVVRFYTLMLIIGKELKYSTLAPVAGLLCRNSGEGLLVHPLIISTVSRTWKYGRVATLPPDAGFFSRLFYRMKSLGAPR